MHVPCSSKRMGLEKIFREVAEQCAERVIDSGIPCCGMAGDRGTLSPNNTTQHNTIQHNTTQHNTTQHNTTQHNTTQLKYKNLHNTQPIQHTHNSHTQHYTHNSHTQHTTQHTTLSETTHTTHNSHTQHNTLKYNNLHPTQVYPIRSWQHRHSIPWVGRIAYQLTVRMGYPTAAPAR